MEKNKIGVVPTISDEEKITFGCFMYDTSYSTNDRAEILDYNSVVDSFDVESIGHEPIHSMVLTCSNKSFVVYSATSPEDYDRLLKHIQNHYYYKTPKNDHFGDFAFIWKEIGAHLSDQAQLRKKADKALKHITGVPLDHEFKVELHHIAKPAPMDKLRACIQTDDVPDQYTQFALSFMDEMPNIINPQVALFALEMLKTSRASDFGDDVDYQPIRIFTTIEHYVRGFTNEIKDIVDMNVGILCNNGRLMNRNVYILTLPRDHFKLSKIDLAAIHKYVSDITIEIRLYHGSTLLMMDTVGIGGRNGMSLPTYMHSYSQSVIHELFKSFNGLVIGQLDGSDAHNTLADRSLYPICIYADELQRTCSDAIRKFAGDSDGRIVKAHCGIIAKQLNLPSELAPAYMRIADKLYDVGGTVGFPAYYIYETYQIVREMLIDPSIFQHMHTFIQDGFSNSRCSSWYEQILNILREMYDKGWFDPNSDIISNHDFSSNCEEMSQTDGDDGDVWSRYLNSFNRVFGIDSNAPSRTTDYHSKDAKKEPNAHYSSEMDDLIGLDDVKKMTRNIVDHFTALNIYKNNDLKVPTVSRHMVFRGNPGTCKTTVARIISRMLADKGITNGTFIEAGRSDLVAGYVGQTAIKIRQTFESAEGGVLFIDEAYSLASDAGVNSGYGNEAISTIVQLMENMRENIIVIFAGYRDEMATFIKSNPGMASRIAFTVDFPDYDEESLVKIFDKVYSEQGFEMSKTAHEKLIDGVHRDYEVIKKGNGRSMRSIFEHALMNHSHRIVNMEDRTREDVITINEADITSAWQDVIDSLKSGNDDHISANAVHRVGF